MKPELTLRQLQVATLILKGRLSKQIAGDLNVSIKTIEKHRQLIFRKLNCYNVLSLAKKCLKSSIISIEEFLKD